MGIEKFDAARSVITSVTDVYGTLDKIKELNKNGKFAIIAPNHIAPHSALRRNLALANDFWALKRVFSDKWIQSLRVVFRWDSDSSQDTIVYRVSAKVSHLLWKALVDGYPIHINTKNNPAAMKRNTVDVRNILKWLEKENIALYPYWNRYQSGEQEFDLDTAIHTWESRAYNFEKDGEKTWHNGIKPWFVKLARKKWLPIVPVYNYMDENGAYQMVVGKMISVQWKSDIEVITEYVSEMKHLKSQILPLK